MTQITDVSSTSSWVRFFAESGIPQSVAANYAVTFVENRITKQMLLDLSKEILHDMGIAVMGDIIAILKHAKIVHAQLTRDKVFKGELSVVSVPPARRAVTGVASITTGVDKPTKVITEPLNKVIVTTRTPVKRKLENEVTVGKKLRVVKGGITAENKSIKMDERFNGLNKVQNTNVVVKPPVFQRLSGGNGTNVAKKKIQSLNIKNTSPQEVISATTTVFDRLGPKQLPTMIKTGEQPQVKSALFRSSFQGATAKVDRNVAATTTSVNRKIVFSLPTTKSDSPDLLTKKNVVLRNTGLTAKPLKTTRISTITRGGVSQGIFASDFTSMKSNPIRQRLQLDSKLATASPSIRRKLGSANTFRPQVIKTSSVRSSEMRSVGVDNRPSRNIVSTVSGSVFSRLGR